MQYDLTMAEIDSLRPTRGSRRVEYCRAGVLVEIREREVLRADRQQRLVFALDREIGLRRLGPVMHENVVLNRLQMGLELLQQRQEVGIEQNRGRAGVVDRIGDVFRDQAEVDRLHDRAHHRNGEVAFVIAVAVPFEDGDDVALLDADIGEAAGEPSDAFAKLPIGAAPQVAIDDLLVGRAHHRGVQEMLDEQRIGVGRRGRRNDLDGHGAASLSLVKCKLRSGPCALTRIKNCRGNVTLARRRRHARPRRWRGKRAATRALGRNGVQVPSG